MFHILIHLGFTSRLKSGKMGVIDINNACSSSICMIKSSIGKPGFGIDVNERRVVSMVSASQASGKSHQKISGESFIRPHLRNLSPSQSNEPFEVVSARLGRKPEDIRLDTDENPYGPPPEVYEALGNMKYPHIYPDQASRELRTAVAKGSGLEPEYILAGCGVEELIDLIMRCVVEPGAKVLNYPPTFEMYEFNANVHGAVFLKVPRNADFSLNVEQIIETVEQEKPKCIFLTSPNDPDGSIINDSDLLKILELPILVVLDEANIEFSELDSRMKWVKQHQNLIVLRNFTKRAGLAGLRIGYGAFPENFIKYMWTAKQPYSVSVPAELATCAALENLAHLENVKDALVKERERLYKLLEGVPFLKPYPSYANFILCEVTSGLDAKKLKEDLVKMGVLIRHYDSQELCGYVRVSVGKPEHTEALMKCLNQIS